MDISLRPIERYGFSIMSFVDADGHAPLTFFDHIAPAASMALPLSGNSDSVPKTSLRRDFIASRNASLEEIKEHFGSDHPPATADIPKFNLAPIQTSGLDGSQFQDALLKYASDGKANIDEKEARRNIDAFFSDPKNPNYNKMRWDDHSGDNLGYDELINFDVNSKFIVFALKYGYFSKLIDMANRQELTCKDLLDAEIDDGKIRADDIPRLLIENRQKMINHVLKPLVVTSFYDNIEAYPYIIQILADYIKADIVIVDSVSKEKIWYRTANSSGTIIMERHPLYYSLMSKDLLTDEQVNKLI
jgi:hypothetical protein